jgi:hypothetical protein
MRTAFRQHAAAFAFSLCVAAPVAAERIVFVPWKVLPRGTETADNGSLSLYWVPSSPDEMRRSDLITSPGLAALSSRCVAMYVVRADDEARIQALGVAGALPAAVLADRTGPLLRIEKNGPLHSVDLEQILRDEVSRREVKASTTLDRGRRHAAAGEWNQAAAAFREVAAQKCAFPRMARSAERALAKIDIEKLSGVRNASEHP